MLLFTGSVHPPPSFSSSFYPNINGRVSEEITGCVNVNTKEETGTEVPLGIQTIHREIGLTHLQEIDVKIHGVTVFSFNP